MNHLSLKCTARLLSMLMCLHFFIKRSRMVEDLRRFKSYGYFRVTYFGIGLASVNEKRHLRNPLVRSCPLATTCRYLSVCQNYQNIPIGLSAMAIFAN